MSRYHAKAGRPYRRNRALLLQASDICWLCQHPGADGADHIIPVSRGGPRDDITNMRPAHTKAPCPVCGKWCNSSRGNSMDLRPPPPQPSRRWY